MKDNSNIKVNDYNDVKLSSFKNDNEDFITDKLKKFK